MQRRTLLLLAGGWAAFAQAQPDWRRQAVPFVTAEQYLEALYTRWYEPRARQFAAAASALVEAQRAHCAKADLPAARTAWLRTMTAWERLNAVAIGPLLQRRSARRIDFTPVRAAAVERAIRDGATDLALVGGPAKGLPALEWLLWRRPVASGSNACGYALRVAQDIAAEADALAAAFAQPRSWDESSQASAFAEVVNQFVGGVEALRWGQIGKPLQEGRGRHARSESKGTAAAWGARWDALRTLTAWQAEAPDTPVSLEMLLRGRGLNPLADRLRAAVESAGKAMAGAAPGKASLPRAVRELSALKRRMEGEVAPALDVSIGFSDADGD